MTDPTPADPAPSPEDATPEDATPEVAHAENPETPDAEDANGGAPPLAGPDGAPTARRRVGRYVLASVGALAVVGGLTVGAVALFDDFGGHDRGRDRMAQGAHDDGERGGPSDRGGHDRGRNGRGDRDGR
jgi:hypothetical protein